MTSFFESEHSKLQGSQKGIFITLNKTSGDLFNTSLHEFTHTFDNRSRNENHHDEQFRDVFRLIYLKAWSYDLLSNQDIEQQNMFDLISQSERHSRSNESGDLKKTRDEKVLEWYNRFKQEERLHIHSDENSVLRYDNLSEFHQEDFKKYIQELPLRNFYEEY